MAFSWFKKKKSPPSPDVAVDAAEETPSTDDPTPPADGGPPAGDGITEESTPAVERKVARPAEAPDGPLEHEGPPQPSGKGLFARLKSGLAKTRKILTTDIDELFLGKKIVDEGMIEDLEELLITADMGVQTTMDIMARIGNRRSRISSPEELKQALKEEILSYFTALPAPDVAPRTKPHVVMVVGVNGVGKTTTIGKLAAHEARQGRKVLIAAADTFRAAAIDQIAIWAERAGADIVRHKDHADPAAVAYDSVEAAVSRGMDTVFIDTAGRLHTKVNLMEEIKKIQRTLAKRLADAPHEVLLVLDATTGQNALSQANLFNEALGVTGIALTKLDGTAKGGIVVSICASLKIPLQYVGVGEGVADLQAFDPRRFVDALF